MADLISRPHLLSRSIPHDSEAADPCESAAFNFTLGYETARQQIVDVIKSEPAVEDTPTLCRDCKHCHIQDAVEFFYCDAWDMEFYEPTYSPDTYFCADAERRDDDADA